jgi:hypothetical protein
MSGLESVGGETPPPTHLVGWGGKALPMVGADRGNLRADARTRQSSPVDGTFGNADPGQCLASPLGGWAGLLCAVARSDEPEGWVLLVGVCSDKTRRLIAAAPE